MEEEQVGTGGRGLSCKKLLRGRSHPQVTSLNSTVIVYGETDLPLYTLSLSFDLRKQTTTRPPYFSSKHRLLCRSLPLLGGEV